MIKKQISNLQAIHRVLTTPLGSRVMRPQFGSELYKLIDRGMGGDFAMDARHYTYEAIESNLPEISIADVRSEQMAIVVSLESGEEVRVEFAA